MDRTLERILSLVDQKETKLIDLSQNNGVTISKGEKHDQKKRTKLVCEEPYVAEIDSELIETDEGWNPHLSLNDAQKIDGVRDALRQGDPGTADHSDNSISRTYNKGI